MEAVKLVFLLLALICTVSAFHPKFFRNPHHRHSHHQKRRGSTRQNNPGAIVQTADGPVRGLQRQTVDQSKNYISFTGVPYAKPPVGDLRFRPPQSPDKWTDVYDATIERNICTQTDPSNNDTIGDENCLFINVYTPQLPDNNSQLLPVVIYFYGGAWIYSDGNYESYGPDYLIDDGVLVVTLNFRLGIFGFLSTGDDASPGNNGLRDQLLAVQWVQNNIAAFGGDPKQVTLYGESSGGTSIAYFLQLQSTAGLYKGAILHSGTSLVIWALARFAQQGAFHTAAALNISTGNTSELVESLRQVEFKKLQSASSDVESKLLEADSLNGFVYGPVREHQHDGAIFTGLSYEELKSGSYNHVPILIGYNSEEASGMYPLNGAVLQSLERDSSAGILVPADMHITNVAHRRTVGQLIKEHYFGRSGRYTQRQIFRYLTDDQFLRGVRKYAQLVMNSEPTYFFRFSYLGELGNPNRTNTYGVGHAEDINYVFQVDHQNASSQDQTVRHRLVRLFTNFAKTQNPTPERTPFLDNQIWPLANTTSNITYLDINFNLTVKSNPRGCDMDFWDILYEKFAVRPFDTY